MLCRFSFEKIYYTFAEEPDKFFRTTLKVKVFEFVRKRLEEHLKSWETSRVRRPNVLIVSAGPGFKRLSEWIRYLYNYIIDRLFGATSQSTKNRRVQTLRLDTNQLALIWGPTVL